MQFYADAHLAVLAARAGCAVDKDSLLGQAQERLHIYQSDRTDSTEEIESVDEQDE